MFERIKFKFEKKIIMQRNLTKSNSQSLMCTHNQHKMKSFI